MAGDDENSEIGRLRKASASDPAAAVKLVDQLVAAGRAEEAIAFCRTAIVVRPDDVPIRLALGRALSAIGELDEAQEAFREASVRQKAAKAKAAAAGAAPPVAAPSPLTPPPEERTEVGAPPPAMGEDDEATTLARRRVVLTPSTGYESPAPASRVRDSMEVELDFEELTPTPAPADLSGRLAAMKAAAQPTIKSETAIPSPARPIAAAPIAAPKPIAPAPAPRSAAPAPAARPAAAAPPSAAPAPARAIAPAAKAAPSAPPATVTTPTTTPGTRAAAVAAQGGPVDLDAIAQRLHDAQPAEIPVITKTARRAEDPVEWAFFRARRRTHIWMWASLIAISGGIIGGTVYRIKQIRAAIAQKVALAADQTAQASFEGDVAARDALVSVLTSRLHDRRHLALASLASARLYAEDGDETEGAVQALLRRADKEAQRKELEPDPVADGLFRRTRALLAIGHGEPCPPTITPADEQADGAIGARCALRRGDLPAARKALESAIAADPGDVRALEELGFLALGNGELDAADDAFKKALAARPEHTRALIGRSIVSVERGKPEPLGAMPPKLGVTTEAWWHLAVAMGAIARGDEAAATSELDSAQTGILRDGRLAARVGLSRIALGKVTDAERALRVAVRLGQGEPDLEALDAEIAVAKGFEEKVAQNLAGRDGPPRILAIRGRAELLAGKPKEASQTLEAALVRRPNDVVAATYKALARAQNGQASPAVRDLEKLAAKSPLPTTPHYALGILAFERHDLQAARVELTKAVVKNPEAFRAGAWLGRVDRELGRTADAVAELEKVTQDVDSLVSAHVTLGRLYHDLGRESEARRELQRALDAKKASGEDQLALAEANIALLQLKDADGLLTGALAAGAPAPRVQRARLVLQSAKAGSGPAAVAAAKGLEALKKAAPKDAILATLAGDAWRRAGDAKKAADNYRLAAANGTDKLHPNLGLGRALLATNDNAGAEAAYRAAVTTWSSAPYGEEDRTEARIGLGRALLGRKAYTDAVQVLEQARDDDPDAAEPHYWLARGYADVSDNGKARNEVDRAVSLDDRYAAAWLLLADLTEKSDKPTAKRALSTYLELAPDAPGSKGIKRRLAALK